MLYVQQSCFVSLICMSTGPPPPTSPEEIPSNEPKLDARVVASPNYTCPSAARTRHDFSLPTHRSSTYALWTCCVDIAPEYPAAPQPCLLLFQSFRDVGKWRGRATASLGNKSHQRWLHPCLVSKLTAPAPSTLIPSEPVNRFP